MPRRPARPVSIDRPAQLRALGSPVRQEILDVLESAGPCPVAELGRLLGRAPDSLYFHVRQLVRVGLVVEVGREKNGRHAFAVYDVVGRPLRIDRRKARRAPEMGRIAGGILRLALRDHERGRKGRDAVVEGPSRNLWVARVQGWVRDEDLAAVNEHLERALELVREARPGPGRRPVALALGLAPAAPRRGAEDT